MMKKIIFVLVCCFVANSLLAQDKTTGFFPDCPAGTYPVFMNYCDVVNFHRPVTGCTHGFWFCTMGCTGWYIECMGNARIYKASVTDNKANIWGQIVKNQIELHFPIALQKIPGYTAEDLKTFSVDEDDNFFKTDSYSLTMLKGQYPVKQTADELIILVNIR